MRGLAGAGRSGFRGWRRWRTLVVGCSVLALVPAVVLAASASAGGPSASASVGERVARLEANEAHRTLTSGYVARARIALDRAGKLRASGNEADAVIADRAASTWLEAAETLARSVDRETEAASLELGVLDAGARAERERALLEEALGNAGRRRAELARIERERSSPLPRVRTADIDGGVNAGGKTSVTGTSLDGGASSSGGRPPFSAPGRDGGGLELRLPGPGAGAGKRRGNGVPSEESPP